MESQNFKDGIVLFADLLGFTAALEEDGTQYAESLLSAAESKLSETGAFRDHDHVARLGLSDSLFVVYESGESAILGSSKILQTCCATYMLVRAGLSMGKVELRRRLLQPEFDPISLMNLMYGNAKDAPKKRFVHDGNIVGRAVATAVALEKRLKGPRICVDQVTAMKIRESALGKLVVVPTDQFEVWEILWPLVTSNDPASVGEDLGEWHKKALHTLDTSHGTFKMTTEIEKDLIDVIFEETKARMEEKLKERVKDEVKQKQLLEELLRDERPGIEQRIGAIRRMRSEAARDHVRGFYSLVLRCCEALKSCGNLGRVKDDKGGCANSPEFWAHADKTMSTCTGLPDSFVHAYQFARRRLLDS